MYPPHSFGGYELLWRSAVEHLRERGHETRVLTTDFSAGMREPDEPDVHRELRWYWRDHSFPRLAPWTLARLERHNHAILARHLSDLRPDVVSWWAMGGMSLSLLERVRRSGLPAVAFVIDHWLDYGPHVDHWLRSFGGRKAVAAPIAERLIGIPARVRLGDAARYVFASDAVERRALGAVPGIRERGIARCGIHERFLEPAPPEPWSWRLLYVGRIDERKGIHTAVDALERLPEGTTLTVVGTWDKRAERQLAERAAARGVAARVTFAGQRGQAELPAYYADADAVVFPVIWEEPWGLVPLEAMGRGRPVVATGRGGSGEYLRDGENCLLFEAGDPNALAAAVTRLAEDSALRDRLRIAGMKTASEYTEARFNEVVEDELARAVSRQALGRESALA